MTARVRMPMQRRLRALRLHRVPRAGREPAADQRAVWLLRLGEIAAQEARCRAELAACAQAVQRALADVRELVQRNLDQAASLATEIGLGLAREVVGHALDRGFVDPTPVVRRCLEEATLGRSDPELEVQLHPEDLALVVHELDRDPALREALGRVQFTPTASLPRAAVRVATGAGRLLYDHREVLDRMADEVRRALGCVEPR